MAETGEASKTPQRAGVHLVPLDAAWDSVERRDSAVTPLATAGFVHAGQFGVREDAALHLLVMHHPAVATYAIICERGTTRWVELIRWHADGSILLATNGTADTDAWPTIRVISKPDAGVSELVSLMRAETLPAESMAVRPDEFAGRYEAAYASRS